MYKYRGTNIEVKFPEGYVNMIGSMDEVMSPLETKVLKKTK